MIRTATDLSRAARSRFDAIIDVRSPSEFAVDHAPGAINLPVLDDAERAEVGTEYVQGSKFLARRRGAALVARNIARHLETTLVGRDGSFQPLVYCWRGGQRSHAMATVMDQVGWPVTLLEGGYRTWRRQVTTALYDRPLGHRFVRIDGPTGAGKTALLQALATRGTPVLDLEALANHRGSLFGARPEGQPSQKLFESRLFAALEMLDAARPVAVEAEASRIGDLMLPPSLWKAMAEGPTVTLQASLERRVRRILADYAGMAQDLAGIEAALARLPPHISKAQRAEWLELAREGRLEAMVEGLIRDHYDPAYARGRRKADVVVEAEDVAGVLAAIDRTEDRR